MSVKIIAINIDVDSNGRVLDGILSDLVIKLHYEMMSDGLDYRASDISQYTNYVAHIDTLLKVVFYKKWRIDLQSRYIDVVALFIDGQDEPLGYYKILSNGADLTPLLGLGVKEYWLEEMKVDDRVKKKGDTAFGDSSQKDKLVETKTSSVKLMGVVEEVSPETFMPF